MKTIIATIYIVALSLASVSNSHSQVIHVTPVQASYNNLMLAFTAINSGIHGTGSVAVVISGNSNEIAPAVLNGGIFQACSITTSGNFTVTGNFDEALIVLNGADNVTFDGLNNLTLQNMNPGNNSGCIRLSNGANSNTIKNLKCVGFGSGGLLGGRLINIAQSFPGTGGNNDNTVENCDIRGGRRGIQTFGTAGVHINMRTRVINNSVRNFSSLGIFIGSETLDNVVSGNKLFYDAPIANDTAGVRAISIQGCGTTTVSSNHVYALSGTLEGGFVGIISIPAVFTSPFSTPQTNVEIHNNMVALNNCVSTATFIYGIISASNAGTINYNSRILNNSIFIGGSSGSASADNECLVVAQNGSHGPEEVSVYNNISINGRTGGDNSTLHVGQYILPSEDVVIQADNNIAFAYDNTGRGWDAGYRFTLYRETGGQEIYKDTLCGSGMEQSSAFIPVAFISDTDLHLESSLVGTNMNAKPFPHVSTDYDGQLRIVNGSNLFTYRGADEIHGGKKSYRIYFKLEEKNRYPYRVKIALRNPSPPYSIVDNAWINISEWITNTTISSASLHTGPGIISGNYFVEMSSKHSIVTQSSVPVSFFGDTGSYDFTSAQTQSFGSNSVLVNESWGFFNGDVNQDEFIDAADVSQIYNDAYEFASGCHLNTDVNDDGSVDGSDVLIADNNAVNFVSAVLLPGTSSGTSREGNSEVTKILTRFEPQIAGRVSSINAVQQ